MAARLLDPPIYGEVNRSLNQKELRLTAARTLFASIPINSKAFVISLVLVLVYCTTRGGTSAPWNQPNNNLLSAGEQCRKSQWQYPDCNKFKDKATPPFSDQQWLRFREIYVEIVGEQASTLGPGWSNLTEENNTLANNAFHIPFGVRAASGKGLGVFTKDYVQQGQQLWDNGMTARFPDECSVRVFLASISEEDACSTIKWGYVNDFFGQGLQFQLDMADGVYFNHADSGSELLNTYNSFLPTGQAADELAASSETSQPVLETKKTFAMQTIPGQFCIFATQDLEPGTELLLDYSAVHAHFRLYWYEKLTYQSRGFWPYIWLV